MYTTLKEVLAKAERLNFTVGSFNTHNLEMLPPMLRAAKDMGSPIIVQTSAGTAKYIGFGVLTSVCKHMAEQEGLDIVLHLDHASKFADIREAIDNGYSSVMFDGSALPFKENILRTQEVVEFAHARGVSVEAELGTIGGTEEGVATVGEAIFTDPKAAEEFVEATRVDALAVAVGTNHGQYQSKTNLNLPLLKELHHTIATPMVIHGGTGVMEEDIRQCTQYGVRKFNVGTELLVGWTRKATEMFGKTKENASLRNNIVPCNEAVYEIVKHKIDIFLNR